MAFSAGAYGFMRSIGNWWETEKLGAVGGVCAYSIGSDFEWLAQLEWTPFHRYISNRRESLRF